MVHMILVNMQIVKLLAYFCTFRDMTSQKFLFQNRMSHRNSIFTPYDEGTTTQKQSLFMPENISLGTNLYPPMHFHGFEAEQKNCMFNFRDISFQKQLQEPPFPPPPPVNRFC